MIRVENHVLLMSKADRALASARLLLDSGDADGACNRAYYAMFDAARAALSALSIQDMAHAAKTHNGLIGAFGLQLIKTGQIPKELGKMLNRAEEVRLLADYTGGSVELTDADDLVDQAATFVNAIRCHLASST